MISFDNTVDIHITKIYGEQVSIEKVNPHQSKKVMGVWKNPLGYITKIQQTFKIRYKNITISFKMVISMEIMCGQFSGELCGLVSRMRYW